MTTMELSDRLLDDDDRALRDMIRPLAEERIAPLAMRIDQESLFPAEPMALLAELGMLGISIPEEDGGSGGTKLQYSIVVEELARVCASTSLTYMTQVHGATPLLIAGSEAQKQRYIPPMTSGALMSGIALTEPQAGSDAGSMTTTALPIDGGYRISGQKIFITNGGHAGLLCLFASTDRSKGARGLTAFIVETDRPGISAGKPLKKMGMRGSDTVELFIDSLEVGAEHVLGGEGEGFSIAMKTLDTARLSTAAQAIGIAQGAYERALRYALDREQFGRRIFDFQAVQFRLVEMYSRITTARLLTYQVARAMSEDPGASHGRDVAHAKVLASDAAMFVTTEAVQVLGGYGYMVEYEVERMMRDAKVTQIYDGTNDINRLVVARAISAGA